MRHLQFRHLAFAVLLALPAQPAFARGHSHESHSEVYRHHHARGVHHRHHHYVRHRGDAFAAAQTQNSGTQFPFVFGTPSQQSWQQSSQQPQTRASRRTMQTQRAAPASQNSAYSGIVAQQAAVNGVPVSLVHRVIMRESRYNPRAVSRGNYGIMQIRLGTARSMGYSGSAAGLLDANTGMTYAVRYLAGAYRAAGGNESRAVALYARGYGARGSRHSRLHA